jgi:DNA mismatch repair protein MutL
MAIIKLLPPEVISQIAAGEIIERPASIVKELVENSLDAQSKRIDIEIEQGGHDLIRVVDDGCGIYPEQLQLALTSHATSKLKSSEDLFRISTLGFRGEALGSIASVSKFLLQSCPPDLDQGAEILCEGGLLHPAKPWNGSPGTRIEIKHLFYNTPVRRKFLKAPPAETAQITETITKMILSSFRNNLDKCEVHWSYKNNGKQVLQASQGASLKEMISIFFGKDITNDLLYIESNHRDFKIKGYIGSPNLDKSSAKSQYLFINGRWFRDRTISHAIQEGFRGHMMTGRFPIAFLYFDSDLEKVDVNIHPTKSEVRFRDPGTIHHLVFNAVRNVLLDKNKGAVFQLQDEPPFTRKNPIDIGLPEFTITIPQKTNPPEPWTLESGPSPAPSLPFNYKNSPSEQPEPENHSSDESSAQAPNYTYSEKPQAPTIAPVLFKEENFKVLQVYNSYIVIETDEGVLIIDQHALHERILYEQLKTKLSSGPVPAQKLLIPETIELAAFQSELVLSRQEELQQLGFEIRGFGGNTILVESYPALLGRKSPKALFNKVIEQLFAKDEIPSKDAFFHHILSLTACHSAVRSGDTLNETEMHLLAKMRHLSKSHYHCPHGRPTSLLISKNDLENQFGRT